MKFLRRLSRHGHSAHIAVSPQLMNFLRWQVGDILTVEPDENLSLRVRRATPADMAANMVAMTVSSAVPESQP
jgi:antitoxin component of MazEF toxin-antitoxin module